MLTTEKNEHIDQLTPRKEVEKTQRELELAGEWDNDKRREAVRQNELELKDRAPLSYEDSLSFLKQYEEDFIDAGLESAQDDIEHVNWQIVADKMRVDLDLAKVGSQPSIERLINEVERHLESLGHMKEEGGDDASIHEGDIQDLRRVRDALFTRYEQIPSVGMRESFESVYGGLTGRAPAEHLRNGVKKKDETPEKESSNEKPEPGLEEALELTDRALPKFFAIERFVKEFRGVSTMPPDIASRMAEELLSLYQEHAQGQESIEGYEKKADKLFERYHEELKALQAA